MNSATKEGLLKLSAGAWVHEAPQMWSPFNKGILTDTILDHAVLYYNITHYYTILQVTMQYHTIPD